MKILLLGHKGYLGSYLIKNLPVDTLSERNVYDNGLKYEYIINCIGIPNLEYCEEHLPESNYSNWIVMRDIIQYYPNAKVINFSSYYVYDDYGMCDENTNTTDRYAYTRQKLNSERLVQNGISFRLGKLFGNKDQKQFKLLDYIINNDELILDSVLFNPTSVKQVLNVINYELSHNNLYGIYNLSNLGFTSPYELGIFINNILNLNKKITRIEKMDRIFHNYGKFLMDVSKLNKNLPLTIWQTDLKEYLLC